MQILVNEVNNNFTKKIKRHCVIFLLLFYYTFAEIVIQIVSSTGAPVAQWVKRRTIDSADRFRSPLEVKSSRP